MSAAAGRDRIELRGLRVLGTHGALPEEQVRAQPFEVDLDIDADLDPAARSDRLEDTVDYAAVVAQAALVVETERHVLLERVAARIADEVLRDARVRSVTVTIRKLRPPLPFMLGSTGVRMVRP